MNKYYHVTVLSNFLTGFNKYQRIYDKSLISQSTYSNIFFLLRKKDLSIGINKASKLLVKLGLPDDRLIAIETVVDPSLVYENNITDTKLGEYIQGDCIKVNKVFYLIKEQLTEMRIEDVVASSYQVNLVNQVDYSELIPRSLSFLPIAKGCQAKCAFCFSTASISSEQKQGSMTLDVIRRSLIKASAVGAFRAVITGGGEPGLLSKEKLNQIISICNEYMDTVVLITNGYSLANDHNITSTLDQLSSSGLTVLSVSRHHYDSGINSKLMSLDIESEIISQDFLTNERPTTLRWVCVLQKGGIDTSEALQKYIDWTFQQGVTQICFKELYVSSSSESVYFSQAANDWSYQNQVPLSLVTEMAEQQSWELVNQLPWGSPVYRIRRGERSITVAAYTEPSVSWELANKQCRSWNVMSNGDCFASLESKNSMIDIV